MGEVSIRNMDLRDKRVLMRVDFNVPLDAQQQITDATRIQAALPTIKYILNKNCSLILMSHLGRPKGKVAPELSLKPVARRLKELLGRKVIMAPDCVGEKVKELVTDLKSGEVLLLENLRFHSEEEKNDENFARQLASFGEVFVQDAFGVVHRAHASTAGIPKFLPSAAGLLLEKEIKFIGGALANPARPFIAILGGAKISGKIDVIKNLLDKVDELLIGGAMTYTFLRAQGKEVGTSLVEEDKIDLAQKILKISEEKKVPIRLPIDHLVADKLGKEAITRIVKDLPAGWRGVDIGPETTKLYADELKKAKTVVWNGPLGIFEIEKFAQGTYAMARLLGQITAEGATTIVGGGDSVAAVEKAGLKNKLSWVSTGGGASLEFLEGKQLPGIIALQDKE